MNKKKTIVLGLGKTGLSCVRYLQHQSVDLVVMDTRSSPPRLDTLKAEYPSIPVFLGELNQAELLKANEIVISPGISLKEPAIAACLEKGISVVGDIELFCRVATAPIIAITGSNGKTTVTTLIGLMVERSGLRVEVCGNIGEPVLDTLDREPPDFYVMELSSFQLETMHSLNAKAAVVLNVSPDHMDRYSHYEEYIAAKRLIYHHCGIPIINLAESIIWKACVDIQNAIGFDLKPPKPGEFGLVENEEEKYLAFGEQYLLSVDDMPLKAPHHWQNALACLALGHAVGLSFYTMCEVLKQFEGLKHRCQLVREWNDVKWYNDSKGTNVGASVTALQSVASVQKGRVVLILGGDAKSADLEPLKQPVELYASHVILIGRDAPRFEALLKNVLPLMNASTLEDAVKHAAKIAKPGDCVLLSPACASYDMFNNYEHRGDVFIKAVEAL